MRGEQGPREFKTDHRTRQQAGALKPKEILDGDQKILSLK